MVGAAIVVVSIIVTPVIALMLDDGQDAFALPIGWVAGLITGVCVVLFG